MLNKLAGDASDFVRIMLKAGFEKVHGGKHIKYHPPKYIDSRGEERDPVYLNVDGADPETIGKPIFITLSTSMDGKNRNEVQSWKRVFKALDNYPHMIEAFEGRLPSEVFDEWDGTPQKKQEKAEGDISSFKPVTEKIPTILDNEYKVLPVWCTSAKPYFEEFNALKPEFIIAKEALDKANKDLEQARIKGYPTKLNQAKVDNLVQNFEPLKASLEKVSQKLISFISGDKSFKSAEDVVSFIQKRLEKGYEYSILSLDTVSQFIVLLPLTEYSLKGSPDSVYEDICDVLGIKEFNDKVKNNIDGTIKYLVNSKKIEIDSDKNIKYSNQKINLLLRKLGQALGFIKVAEKKKKRTPTNKPLWARAIAEAKKKYDVYPCVPVSKSYALTENGWKGFYDLKVGDKIISYNRKENCLEWDVIKNLHFYKNADTIRIYKANTCFDFICTKDHKWVIKNKEKTSDKKYKYEDQLVRTEDITKHMNIITSAKMKNSNSISLSDFRKHNWSWTEKILAMSNEQREAWLASAIIYDGHENNYSSAYNRASYGFSQKNKDHGDAAAICAALLGYNVSFKEKKHNPEISSFIFINRQTHNTQNMLKENFVNCDVWCPETNNGTWLMKQDRMITITGNSAYANGYALKWYKEHGGGWRGKKKI